MNVAAKTETSGMLERNIGEMDIWSVDFLSLGVWYSVTGSRESCQHLYSVLDASFSCVSAKLYHGVLLISQFVHVDPNDADTH